VNLAEGTIKSVVSLLVTGEYETLASLTSGRMLSAEEMRRAVEDYGRTLVMPPDKAFAELDHGTVKDSTPPRHWYAVPLWTLEQGRSDLEMQLALIEFAPGLLLVEIEGIHVP
jgi:hypothetical protein